MKSIFSLIRKSLLLRGTILGILFPGLLVFPVPTVANPTGGVVVHGNVNFQGGAGMLQINQLSNRAIIDWQDFSISAGEVTRFNQPGASALALNRVVSGNPSQIYGQLRANGGVLLVNPNGIVVGPTGQIDVAGMLTLSTLDITNEDFLNGGSNRFRGTSGAGIVNYGAISSSTGDVVLLGNFLQNAGSVSAPDGTVAFGAGGDIIVDEAGGAKISVLAAGPGGEVGIDNSGTINAAAAELKAHGNVYALAIKNDGLVRASGYRFRGGKLTLNAGSGGRFVNTGTLRAQMEDGSGGTVSVAAQTVDMQSGTVDVSGGVSSPGGSVEVEAESVIIGSDAIIDAEGTDGGTIRIGGGEELNVEGDIRAGGMSGFGGSVDLTATEVTISSSASADVSGAARGGSLRIGGGFQGKADDIENARSVIVENGASLSADSELGNAGSVIVWSDDTTSFGGTITATSVDHRGGFVEVSGAQSLGFYGFVDASSQNGANGILLLDPGDIVVRDNGGTTTSAGAGDTEFIDSTVLTDTLNNDTDVVLFTDGQGGGTITVENNINWNSDASLSLLGHGDIRIDADVQNAGSGDINVVAGWDDSVAPVPGSFTTPGAQTGGNGAGEVGSPTGGGDMATFMDDLETTNRDGFGIGGDVFVNQAATQAVSIGSAHGETNIFGDNIIMIEGSGNDRPSQIGFRDASNANTVVDARDGSDDGATGDINVIGKGEIVLSAAETGQNGRNDSHVMVGHGGSNDGWQVAANRSGDGNLSGDIRVITDGGGLTMRGSNDRSFSQIGHGGQSLVGDKDGHITVIAESIEMNGGVVPGSVDGTNRAGTRIGHGGQESPGSTDVGTDVNGIGYEGDIYVKSETVIRGQTGNEVTNGNGANYWQIGHGGYRSGVIGALDGNNRPTATGVIRETSGSGNPTDNQVSYDMEGHKGAIYVEAATGSIEVFAGSRSQGVVHIGHGGRESHGNHEIAMLSAASDETDGLKDGITVIAGRDIKMDRFDHPSVERPSDVSYVHIGLGGDRAGGRFTGDIDIDLGGAFAMHGGNNRSYAMVGHGGSTDAGSWNSTTLSSRNGHATLSGDISIDAGGDVRMYAGSEESQAFAQVGHGGYYRAADGLQPDNTTIVDPVDAGHNGDITIISGGDVIISAKPEQDGELGEDVGGSLNYAQVGHGGIRAVGDHHGEIIIEADGRVDVIAGFGGWEEYRGGTNDDYDSAQTGDGNYAMIGHGGYESTLHRLQDASVGYLWNGNDQGQGIGMAGNSDITITAGGGLNLIATDVEGALRNDQTDQFDVDDIEFDRSIETIDDDGTDVTITTVGLHGLSDGDFIYLADVEGNAPTAAVEVTVVDAMTFTLVGQGDGSIDDDGDGTFGSAIAAVADDGTDLTIDTSGPHGLNDGDFVILENLEGGATTTSVAIEVVDDDTFIIRDEGNNGITDDGDGTFDIAATREPLTRTLRGFAQVGHVGYSTNDGQRRMTFDSVTKGDITIDVGGSITMRGGDQEQKRTDLNPGLGGVNRHEYNHVMIGHGGQFSRSSYEGNISVTSNDGSVDILAGEGFRDFGRIGHGGYESGITPNDLDSTTVVGTILVRAGQDIILRGKGGVETGAGGNIQFDFAQIGHGAGNMGLTIDDQSITIQANRDVVLEGGLGLRDAYAQVGHGALNNGDGNFSGTIDVTAGRHIRLTNNSGVVVAQDDNGDDVESVRNYAKIGHGDTDSSGRTKSTGEWNGDIYVKAGEDLTSNGGMIGHADPNNGDSLTRSLEGNTFIAVSRNNPFLGGTGELTTNADATFTSGLLGAGTELRFYLPDQNANNVAEGTTVNTSEYTRTPTPDGSRSDEHIAVEHEIENDDDGFVTGMFTPVGDYPDNNFGLYNIYYSELAPIIDEVVDGTDDQVGPVLPPVFDFLPFAFIELFDSFDRQDGLYYYDGYEGQLFVISPSETSEGPEGVPGTSFLEELLDGDLGSQEELDEDQLRRLRRLRQKAGATTITFYAFDPNTSRYSSFRVFGSPRTDIFVGP